VSTSRNGRRWVIDRYMPNQPVGASIPGTCLFGQNAIFEESGYSRIFGSTKDISETHAAANLAYTAATTADSAIVTCAGGSLLTDCVPYQHILIGRELYLIRKINSNTEMVVDPAPTATVAAATITQVPNLHPITRTQAERASLYAGKVIRYREEAIFAVGRGTLKINGSPISTSLTATSSPQVAYPIAGGTYDVRPVGFTRPTAPTVAAIAGGTKGMAATAYTLRASKKRTGFPGHGLASDPVGVTLTAGQRIQVTFAAFDASEGQNAAYLWASRTDDATGGDAWFLVGEYSTVGPHTVDYYNGELGEQYIDDNDPPPPALFVTSANDHLIFCSFGDAPDGSGNAQAPGPGIALSKSNNPEAFPVTFYNYISPAEEIVGVHAGKVGSRQTDATTFFLSQNALNIGRFTGDPLAPMVVTPYSLSGFAHQYSGVVADDYFYGLGGTSLFRTADGANVDRTFSQDVASDLSVIAPSRCFLAHDPGNGWVVLIWSNAQQALVGGKWQSKAWIYNTKTGKWNCPAILGDGSTADFTVCGVATLNQSLYIITTDGKVYQWDTPPTSGTTLTGFIASGFDEFEGGQFDKILRQVKVAGTMAGTITLYRNHDRINLFLGTSTVSKALANVTYESKFFPVWKLNWHFKSLAWRVDFSAPAATRLLDSVTVSAQSRDGFVE